MAREPLRNIASILVDAIFPPRCAGCGRRGVWVCETCAPGVSFFGEPLCQRCGAPAPSPCRCGELNVAIDRLRSAAWDEGWLRTAIRQFKYEGEAARADHLAGLIIDGTGAMPAEAALVPVPLHRSRERRRGYNQSALLAERIGRASGRRVDHVLVRAVATRQQVGLGAAERMGNVRNAFALAPGVECRDRRFVLVDDVCTTGATLGTCAELLKSAGATFVGAVTVARER